MIFIKQIQKSLSFVKNNFVSPEASKSNADVLTTQGQKQPEQRDYSRFSAEQKTLIQNIEQKINELKVQLEALNVWEKVNGKAVTILTHWLKWVDDPEAANTKILLSTYEKRLWEILKQKAVTTSDLSKLQKELEWTLSWLHVKKESGSTSIDSKNLQSMTNKEFLAISPAERLSAITKNNVDASKVVSGEVKNLEFTFTFDGVHNKDLYMKTTAGQVLPQEIGKVTVWGEEYSRQWLGWEFFSVGNRRLTIHEGTKLEIGEPRNIEEMEKIVKENTEKTKEYLAQNTSANPDIVAESLKRGIDPKFANLVFKDIYEKTPKPDRKIVLEEMFTEFDRTRGTFWNNLVMKDWKYNENLSFSLLRKFNGASWKEKAWEFGFAKERIERDTIYEAKWEGHKPYMETIANLSSTYDVPADKIVQLIYHENAKWNPTATPPGSSAYGLGQMIDGTWETYGKGLDRNNPHDQLEATARYMKDIYNRQGCSWEEVLAYYNTWEGIKNLSLSKIAEFTRLNPAIANKHPDKNPANAHEYFTAAVAYYNDMNYSDVV